MSYRANRFLRFCRFLENSLKVVFAYFVFFHFDKFILPYSTNYFLTFSSGFLKDTSHKECVLIIDRVTGEITLEKLSGQMLLKKTRQERRSDKSETMPDSRLPMSTSSSSSSTSSAPPAPQPSASSSSSSRPQTPVSSFKRDSPGTYSKINSVYKKFVKSTCLLTFYFLTFVVSQIISSFFQSYKNSSNQRVKY